MTAILTGHYNRYNSWQKNQNSKGMSHTMADFKQKVTKMNAIGL